MVRTVPEPDAERGRAELLAELDDVEVVLDGGLANRFVGGSHRAELVGTAPSPVVDGLSWNVFEFIASKPRPSDSAYWRGPERRPARPTAREG